MDGIVYRDFDKHEIGENAFYSATNAATARVISMIVNLPAVLEETIQAIKRVEQAKARMTNATESSDIAGRSSRR